MLIKRHGFDRGGVMRDAKTVVDVKRYKSAVRK